PVLAATPYAVTYQWQKNGVNISDGPTGNGSTITGSSTIKLKISGISASDEATYTLVATVTIQTLATTVSVASNGAPLRLMRPPIPTPRPTPTPRLSPNPSVTPTPTPTRKPTPTP